MICRTVKLPDGTAAIVCGARSRTKRCACSAPATLLCDGKLATGKTCDAPICARCSTPGGADIDFCREHAPR